MTQKIHSDRRQHESSKGPLRVLYISHSHPPEDAPLDNMGGMQRVSVQLSESLAQDSSIQLRCLVQKTAWKGIEIKTIGFLLKLLILLPRVEREWKPDVILFSSMVTASMARWLRKRVDVPMVTINHGQDVTMPYGWYQRHVRKIFEAIDGVISVSSATREASIERGMLASKGVALPNGIHVNDFLPKGESEWSVDSVKQLLEIPEAQAKRRIKELKASARAGLERQLGISLGAEPLLLSVGRQVKRKGHAWFIEEVLPKMDDACNYILIGDGPEHQRIQDILKQKASLFREKGIRVYVLGRQEDDVVHKAYAASDLFLMPNIKVPGDMEGFGIVLLEANIHFTPVLCADLEGMRDVVEQGVNGYKVPTKQIDEYVKYINMVIRAKQPEQLAYQAFITVWEKFTWNRVTKQYIQYLYQVS